MIGTMESEQPFFCIVQMWCACLFTCVGTDVFRCTWKSEVEISSLSQQLSALFTEAWSLTEPGVLQLVCGSFSSRSLFLHPEH